MAEMYIVKVFDDDEAYEYEYGNLAHAMEQYQLEKNNAELYRYEYDSHNNNRIMTLLEKK